MIFSTVAGYVDDDVYCTEHSAATTAVGGVDYHSDECTVELHE